jgi:predicted ATP-dependent endonuclease of OLD family
MKILRLEAENFKRLRAVEIAPNGDLVQVTGRNAQGKSSVLDSIAAALLGKDACPSDPIRHGEEKATIRLDLGEVVVTRKFSQGGGSTLTLTNAQGAKFPSPQGMLDKLLGAIAFDPLAFARMKPRDQFDQLRQVAKVELDLDELEALNRRDYDRRTEANREVKQLRAQIEGLPADPLAGAKLVNVDHLVERLSEAADARAACDKEQARRAEAERQLQAKRDRIAALRKEAEGLTAEINVIKADMELWAPLEWPDDPSAIKEEIQQAQEQNSKTRTAAATSEKRKGLLARVEELEGQAKSLTEAQEARQAAKEQALAAAAFPVPGLSLGDGQVVLNGVALAQASSAEQLRVSTALAMAANPKLKVILIREGSLLDEESLRQVAGMASEKGYQVWIEKVDSTRSVGVVIEDGAVLVDHQAARPKAS